MEEKKKLGRPRGRVVGKRIAVNLTPDDYNYFVAYCKDRGLEMSVEIRNMVADFNKRNGKE